MMNSQAFSSGRRRLGCPPLTGLIEWLRRVWDGELAPAAPVVRAVRAGRRIMAAHRRYASGNGDALAGALTYALLVGSAPAVLLCSAALKALRLGPALTAIRTMCGQQAGSGNPARDYLVDFRLDLELLLGATAVVLAAALTAGRWWSPLASIGAVWLVFTAIMRRASWPLPGRPSLAAAARASLIATLATASATKPRPAPGLDPAPAAPTAARPELWVVVPAFNEAAGIRATLGRSVPRPDENPRAEQMVVGHSLRRVRTWGPRRTLLWYADRRCQPATASAMNVR